MEFSRQEYRVGCRFLLQGTFPTQGLNWGLLHCRLVFPIRATREAQHRAHLWFVLLPAGQTSFFFDCTGSSVLVGFSLVAASGGYSLVAVCGLLIVVASLVVEHGFQVLGHL